MNRGWILAGMLGAVLLGCTPGVVNDPRNPRGGEPSRPVQVTLRESQRQVTLEALGLRLTLLEVTDSRCPQNAQCFWSGDASVKLEIAKLGVDYVRQPVYNLSALLEPRQVLAEGYRVKIVSVTPYPSTGASAEKSVTLELTPQN